METGCCWAFCNMWRQAARHSSPRNCQIAKRLDNTAIVCEPEGEKASPMPPLLRWRLPVCGQRHEDASCGGLGFGGRRVGLDPRGRFRFQNGRFPVSTPRLVGGAEQSSQPLAGGDPSMRLWKAEQDCPQFEYGTRVRKDSQDCEQYRRHRQGESIKNFDLCISSTDGAAKEFQIFGRLSNPTRQDF